MKPAWSRCQSSARLGLGRRVRQQAGFEHLQLGATDPRFAERLERIKHQDDLIAIMSAGAYAFTMASQYNTRPRAAEILVDGDQVHVIRPRETLESLFASEQLLP